MASATLPPEPRDPKSITGRTYGYVRASIIDEVESPEAQAGIIATHCRGIGRGLDEVFFDDALSGGLPLANREGGKRLLPNLRRGDHVVVARSDLMCRSFLEFVRTLDGWAELGVVVHLCDVPIGPLAPESTPFRLVIDFLVLFNGSESRRIATRCRRVANSLKAAGRRYTRFAPFGFEWAERGGFTFLVPEPIEQRLCI